MADLLQRLRERKLVQWALAYAAAAWVLLQVLSLMAGTYEWPPVAMRIAVAVAVLGFFVAIVLAWYHGERGAQRISGVELVILGLLLAIGGTLLSRVARLPGGETTTAPVVTRVGSTTKTPVTPTPSAIPIRDKSVAVLPFENMSADANNAYFASGMRDLSLIHI